MEKLFNGKLKIENGKLREINKPTMIVMLNLFQHLTNVVHCIDAETSSA